MPVVDYLIACIDFAYMCFATLMSALGVQPFIGLCSIAKSSDHGQPTSSSSNRAQTLVQLFLSKDRLAIAIRSL